MGDTNKSLRNNRGMTLVEVMMAVAVFGIIMTTFTMAVKGYYHLNTDNLDQIRMMELARAETEMIKSDLNYFNTIVDGNIASRAYPPTYTHDTTGGEETYKIKYKKELTTNPAGTLTGTMLKITVAPDTAADPDSDPDSDPNNYVLASWLPHTTPGGGGDGGGGDGGGGGGDGGHGGGGGGGEDGGGGHGGGGHGGGGNVPLIDITSGTWGTLSDWINPPNKWTVDTAGDLIYKGGGKGQADYIFYKNTSQDFNYVAYLVFSGQGNNNNAEGGITFGTHASSADNKFFISGDGLYYNGIKIYSNVVNLTTGTKYYLQAIKSGTSLKLNFGYVDQNNRILPYTKTWQGNISNGTYYVGLYDNTAGNYTIDFTFPPVVGG